MAGDWIKMRADLHTHPKIVRVMSALKADRLRVVGALHAVWCLFDAHSTDGRLEGYTSDALDLYIGWPGFAAAMISIGWLDADADGIETPAFDEHNGQSAKRRAQEAERKRNDRKVSASTADKKRTREEKRREDIEHKDLSSEKISADAPKGIEPVEPPRKAKRRQSSEEDMTAARWMFDLVQKINPSAKTPNYDIWADEVRLMREIDGRTHVEICELFQWAKRDSFWCANIQSPAKLREKWDQLIEQRARPGRQQASQPNQRFNFSDADRSGDKAAMAASLKRHNVETPVGHVDI